jgi:hypothetical protein
MGAAVSEGGMWMRWREFGVWGGFEGGLEREARSWFVHGLRRVYEMMRDAGRCWEMLRHATTCYHFNF